MRRISRALFTGMSKPDNIFLLLDEERNIKDVKVLDLALPNSSVRTKTP
jgi:hypothetical protein